MSNTIKKNILILYDEISEVLETMEECFEKKLKSENGAISASFLSLKDFSDINVRKQIKMFSIDAIVYIDYDNYNTSLEGYFGPVFNESRKLYPCCDKKAFAYMGYKLGLPIIPTYEVPPTQYPFIAKGRNASGGAETFLIKCKEDFNKLPKVNLGYIYQDYITTSFGLDYRITVLNNKTIYTRKRENKEDFRSNTECGGKITDCDVPEEYKEVAELAAKKLGLDFAGFDIMVGENGKPIICEVNNRPGHSNATSTTNIYDKYVDYIIECVKRGYK